MKNIKQWEPTKFVYDNKGNFKANESYVNSRSLFVVNKMAVLYEKYLKKHARGVLVDLGCGTVPLYNVYKDKVDQVICIDWEKSEHKNINLDYTANLNKEIPLKSNSIDTVLLSDVLEHIQSPEKLMSEIGKILRRKGKLIIGVPFLYWLHEEPYDYHRYTRYQLMNLCKDNGLDVLCIEEWGGPFSVMIDIVGKNLPAKLAPKTFQKIANWFINTEFGKKIDNRNKESFPLGYCLVAIKK